VNTIYLDHAATTPLDPAVREAMWPFYEDGFANPSSRHSLGTAAARAIEEAREQVARALGARVEGVVFTSGGTEANNLAVLGLARARRRRGSHVWIGPTEHPCVRAAALALRSEGFEVEVGELGDGARLDLDRFAESLRPDTVLVAQMLVNNEFGTIYPVERLARIARGRAPEALVHVDAVQAFGKVDVSLEGLGVDSLAVSAHKVHGPKGTGALVLADGVRPQPLFHGGGQEADLRSGTENVAGIVGLGVAAELAHERQPRTFAHLGELRDRLRRELEAVPGARLLDPGGADSVSPSIAAILLPGPPAEVWLHHLEVAGVMTSVGSACQAKKGGSSPALLALGLDEGDARRVLRLSFAHVTTADEVRSATTTLARLHEELAGAAPR